MKIAMLTGSVDPHYQLDLLKGLSIQGSVEIDSIGGDNMAEAGSLENNNVHFYNLRGDQSSGAKFLTKTVRIVSYYFKLLGYAVTTDAKVFHIQWPNKFVVFDRTVLNLFYKVLGKRLIHTAHNVNIGDRDGNENFVNWLSHKILYHLMDHIIVHTEKMKEQLCNQFNVQPSKVTVIEHGINMHVPMTSLTPGDARLSLGIPENAKILLFFGNIVEYKGLDVLLEALRKYKDQDGGFFLIIAGRNKVGSHIWNSYQSYIAAHSLSTHIIQEIRFIHDQEIEIFFKAADVLVLPYKYIFQSGILFISYRYGLPVIASDVGSMKDHIISDRSGYIFRPNDPSDLCEKISTYFMSDLFKGLQRNREQIYKHAKDKYSWRKIGEKTVEVYRKAL